MGILPGGTGYSGVSIRNSYCSGATATNSPTEPNQLEPNRIGRSSPREFSRSDLTAAMRDVRFPCTIAPGTSYHAGYLRSRFTAIGSPGGVLTCIAHDAVTHCTTKISIVADGVVNVIASST